MNRTLRVLTLAMLFVTLVAGNALAAPLPPEADTFVDHQVANQTTNYDGDELRLSGSYQGGVCTATRTILLRWNLAAVDREIASAEINLTTADSGSNNAANQQVTLFKVANDTWDETTVTYQTGVVVGDPIGPAVTLPNVSPIPAGQVVTFSGSALVTYLNQEAGTISGGTGDNLASFAVRFTTCATTSTQWFQDKEGGSVAPTLAMFGPNAVKVSETAATPASTFPLYAGLGAVALILVAGLAISRRRTA